MSEIVQKTIRKDVLATKAYHVQDATGLIKLDAMECPYEWPVDLKQEWLEGMQAVSVNRYPDPEGVALKQALRQTFQIKDEYEILLGNGSDEIIQCLITAVAKQDACVMAPEPSFVMFKVIAEQQRVRFCGVPLNQDFSLNLDLFLQNIEQFKPELIFIPQPNNPTGNLFDLSALEAIIQASTGLVVIDEAYTAFSSRSHMTLLDTYKNVVVMRTLSKVGFAGLRLGYLIGRSEWLEEINKVRMPYNINELTQYTAKFALENFQIFEEQTKELRNIRCEFVSFLESFGQKIEITQSDANFVLAKLNGFDAGQLFAVLKEEGVLIKRLHGSHPMLESCLRFTIGAKDEMERLQALLKEFLN